MVGLGVNKLDVNYNIVTSPFYRTLAIAALGYSGPESFLVPGTMLMCCMNFFVCRVNCSIL